MWLWNVLWAKILEEDPNSMSMFLWKTIFLEIHKILQQLWLHLLREWIDACLYALELGAHERADDGRWLARSQKWPDISSHRSSTALQHQWWQIRLHRHWSGGDSHVLPQAHLQPVLPGTHQANYWRRTGRGKACSLGPTRDDWDINSVRTRIEVPTTHKADYDNCISSSSNKSLLLIIKFLAIMSLLLYTHSYKNHNFVLISHWCYTFLTHKFP